ncbi:carboxypeptidase M32 [Collinsella sp. AGMB00827]|uniref:Metal-dependent carboxypeptidase n=1 Tax=Collinsella ureilytica TaxID=2869515 RepID=A0ABS7MLH6_9ACTN|nr:carboxypeptidase M32 [Collinsella urealyticum]MBY4797240.1 carboxypeptidase M32 [Collinsella urealyticum]
MSDHQSSSSLNSELSNVASELRRLERELWSQEYLMKLADFDGSTAAPEQGAAARGEALGYLAEQHHQLLTSGASCSIVRRSRAALDAGELSDQFADEIRVLERDQKEALAIPTDEAVAWTKLICEADAVWHKAKPTGDWESFAPYLDRIISALKRQAAYLDPTRDPYDVWLDQFERGLTAADFDAFCTTVRKTVVPLVAAITKKGQPSCPYLNAHVPEAAQRALSYDLMKLVGLDHSSASLAFTEHPFSEGFAQGDARVATHIYENNLMSNTYSVIHESGHAIYELNVDPAYAYTCLEGGTSMGMHESQSRLFENTLGRSRAFMEPLLRLLRIHAPEVYGSVSEDELYHAVNIATPSLIRTEADELTYPLHIMIRYEIERALFAGELKAETVPARWAELTQSYLGLAVPSNTEGALQDIHWSGGSFGYFPTYALGSAYDAQFVDAMEASGIDLDAACASGNLEPIRSWLKEKIWRWGRAKDAPELIYQACGSTFDPRVFCRYLEDKFSDLYQL